MAQLRELLGNNHKINSMSTNALIIRQAELRRKRNKVKNLKNATKKIDIELNEIQNQLPTYLTRYNA